MQLTPALPQGGRHREGCARHSLWEEAVLLPGDPIDKPFLRNWCQQDRCRSERFGNGSDFPSLMDEAHMDIKDSKESSAKSY